MKAPRPTRPTVPVLAKGKTDTGRLWIYVHDNGPFGGAGATAALFYASRDRTRERPQTHLIDYAGILQADAYDGYKKLYLADRKPSPIREAACWAHARRKFFVLADIEENTRRKAAGKTGIPLSPIAIEVVRRIDALFEIKRSIKGRSPEQRLAVRLAESRPLVDDLVTYMREQAAKLSRGYDLGRRSSTCSTAGGLHAVPRQRRRVHVQQCSRTRAARRGARAEVMAVLRVRPPPPPSRRAMSSSWTTSAAKKAKPPAPSSEPKARTSSFCRLQPRPQSHRTGLRQSAPSTRNY